MQTISHLTNLSEATVGKKWLSQLPQSIDRVCTQWQLDLCGSPYPDSTVSYVVPAKQNGMPVVLKLQWPHEECLYEADALKKWNGVGAVRLLAHSQQEHALLLEPCNPGLSLANSDHIDKLGVVVDLLPKLWVSASTPFKTLQQEARDWQSSLYANWTAANKPMNKTVVQTVYRYIDELLRTDTSEVLLHQDLHAGNILCSQRAPWLAIDPKPLVGEPAFSVSSVVRCAELGHSHNKVVDRLDRLCFDLQLDKERARKWTVVQTFCWSLCDGVQESMFDVVNWLIARESI